jgi:transposase-like protein
MVLFGEKGHRLRNVSSWSIRSQIARKYGIFPSQLFYWRKLMEESGVKGISSKEEVVSNKTI